MRGLFRRVDGADVKNLLLRLEAKGSPDRHDQTHNNQDDTGSALH